MKVNTIQYDTIQYNTTALAPLPARQTAAHLSPAVAAVRAHSPTHHVSRRAGHKNRPVCAARGPGHSRELITPARGDSGGDSGGDSAPDSRLRASGAGRGGGASADGNAIASAAGGAARAAAAAAAVKEAGVFSRSAVEDKLSGDGPFRRPAAAQGGRLSFLVQTDGRVACCGAGGTRVVTIFGAAVVS